MRCPCPICCCCRCVDQMACSLVRYLPLMSLKVPDVPESELLPEAQRLIAVGLDRPLMAGGHSNEVIPFGAFSSEAPRVAALQRLFVVGGSCVPAGVRVERGEWFIPVLREGVSEGSCRCSSLWRIGPPTPSQLMVVGHWVLLTRLNGQLVPFFEEWREARKHAAAAAYWNSGWPPGMPVAATHIPAITKVVVDLEGEGEMRASFFQYSFLCRPVDSAGFELAMPSPGPVDERNPPGIEFVDRSSRRLMRLVTDGERAGQLLWRDQGAQDWGVLREATVEDRVRLGLPF